MADDDIKEDNKAFIVEISETILSFLLIYIVQVFVLN